MSYRGPHISLWIPSLCCILGNMLMYIFGYFLAWRVTCIPGNYCYFSSSKQPLQITFSVRRRSVNPFEVRKKKLLALFTYIIMIILVMIK